MNGQELRALIREVADTIADPDPAAVADKVLGQLSASDARDVLAVCLPGYVTAIVRQDARTARRQTGGDAIESDGARYASPRVAAINRLQSAFFTGSDWKRFGDCTADDLLVAADDRQQRAAALTVEAVRWRSLAVFMRTGGFLTVADVPDAQLDRFLTASAA